MTVQSIGNMHPGAPYLGISLVPQPLELLKEALFTNRSFSTVTSGVRSSNVFSECDVEPEVGF